MIELPGLSSADKKLEEKHDFYVPLSVTLNTVIVVVNILPICASCKARNRKQGRLAMDELILVLSLTSVLFVLVPSAFQLIAFYNRSWQEKQTICHIYQVFVGCLYFANMWLTIYACYARLHTPPHPKLDSSSSPSGMVEMVRLRIAVAGIFACSLCTSCIPLAVLVGSESSYDQRCKFWLFQTTPKTTRHCIVFAVFVVLVASSVLMAVGGVVVVVVSTWSQKNEPHFKQIDSPPCTGSSDQWEERVVGEWSRIAVAISMVLVVTWSFGLVVFILLGMNIVDSDSVAKYTLCSTTLSNLANPIIYDLLSARYRRHYRQIFVVTSRCLFGCPMANSDPNDEASHVGINCNGVCGEIDLFEPRTPRPISRSRVSFTAICSSNSTSQMVKTSTVANINTSDGGCGRPGGLVTGPVSPSLRHYLMEFDPTRGHSSVNPCDYDAIDLKERTYGDGEDWKESVEYESGVSLLTDGSDDGSVSEETEVENADYPQ